MSHSRSVSRIAKGIQTKSYATHCAFRAGISQAICHRADEISSLHTHFRLQALYEEEADADKASDLLAAEETARRFLELDLDDQNLTLTREDYRQCIVAPSIQE